MATGSKKLSSNVPMHHRNLWVCPFAKHHVQHFSTTSPLSLPQSCGLLRGVYILVTGPVLGQRDGDNICFKCSYIPFLLIIFPPFHEPSSFLRISL